MVYNNTIAREVAKYLLEIKAVVLKPEEPFTWASGLKSPIYCDNRKTYSHVEARAFIKQCFTRLVQKNFESAEVIAGVATGAIGYSALVADALNKPLVYVRDKEKSHGLGNMVEGVVFPRQRVVVIEDLISTGGSSLKAVQALRGKEANIMGLAAIFTYGFSEAQKAFEEADCPYITLCDYPTLLGVALEKEYIPEKYKYSLNEWYIDPKAWSNAQD